MDPPSGLAGDLAAVVIVAGGRGERLGMPAKVLVPLAGRPMLAYALDAAQAAAAVRDIVLVVGAHTRAGVVALLGTNVWTKVVAVVDGGERRQDSVAAGVATLSADVALVAIHDAARPLVEPALIEQCLAAAARTGAAIAAVPMTDTVKRVALDWVVATVPREDLWTAQTPQAFRRDVLVAAIAVGEAAGHEVTDEAGWCEALGVPVAIVTGSPTNLKVTRPADLTLAAALLATRWAGREP